MLGNMRRLNVRRLVILLVAITVCGVVIQGLHAFQVHRQSGAFLREADRAEQSGKPQEAVEFLQKYLLLVSQDTKATARLGKLLLEQRRYREALQTFSQVVQRDPKDEGARRQLVDLSMRLRRYQDGQYQLDQFLLKSHPAEGELWIQRGACQQALGDYLPAACSFAIALQKNNASIGAYEGLAQIVADRPQILGDPSFGDRSLVDPSLVRIIAQPLDIDPAAAHKLATLIQQLKKAPSAALSVLDLMVSQNSNSSEAHVARGRFLQSHLGDPMVRAAILGSVEGSDSKQSQNQKMNQKVLDDAKQALARAPSNLPALLLASEGALALDNAREARGFAERASKQEPGNADCYRVLAAVEMREKRPKEAAEWLTRGVKATGGDPTLLWTLADRLIDTNDFQEANQLIARLQAVEAARPIAQYLSARVLIAQSKWTEASRQLEAVGGDLKKWPQLDMLSQFLRAQCYTQLARDDLAIVAYRAALEVNPDWMPARLGLAEALRARGQIDEAVVEFSRLSMLKDAPPQTPMNLLRLSLQQNLSKPPNERKRGWAEIDVKLDKLIQPRPAAAATLLAAEVLVAEERIADARQMLRTAMKAHPKEAALWSALISLESQTMRWDESERLLREMQERFGDSVPFRLTKAEYLVRRFGPARKRDLRALADLPASYSAMDRQSLAMGMAREAMAIQDYEQAERLWQTAADRDPTNLQLPLLLFDLALQRGRPEAMETALGKVRLIEGKDGPISCYGEAIQLVIQAKKQKDKASANALFDKALQQLGEASAHRANWSKTALLAAEINDSLGKPSQAVEKYLEAIELGERNPRILVKALKLMTDQKDDLRAGTLIRKLLDERSRFRQNYRDLPPRRRYEQMSWIGRSSWPRLWRTNRTMSETESGWPESRKFPAKPTRQRRNSAKRRLWLRMTPPPGSGSSSFTRPPAKRTPPNKPSTR